MLDVHSISARYTLYKSGKLEEGLYTYWLWQGLTCQQSPACQSPAGPAEYWLPSFLPASASAAPPSRRGHPRELEQSRSRPLAPSARLRTASISCALSPPAAVKHLLVQLGGLTSVLTTAAACQLLPTSQVGNFTYSKQLGMPSTA